MIHAAGSLNRNDTEGLQARYAIYVSSYYYMCPHTTIHVSSCYYICVLILPYMCPHYICFFFRIGVGGAGAGEGCLHANHRYGLQQHAVGARQGFTAAALLLYCCFTAAMGFSNMLWALGKADCFTSAALLLYCCFTAALLPQWASATCCGR